MKNKAQCQPSALEAAALEKVLSSPRPAEELLDSAARALARGHRMLAGVFLDALEGRDDLTDIEQNRLAKARDLLGSRL